MERRVGEQYLPTAAVLANQGVDRRGNAGSALIDVVLEEVDALVREHADVRRRAEGVARLRVRPAEVICRQHQPPQSAVCLPVPPSHPTSQVTTSGSAHR